VRLGEVVNEGALPNGKPLDGVRILALEQMQALPFATQLLARLGADVIKVEHPDDGDLGRGALPAMDDPHGRRIGATFLRNNLNKRSVGIDLKDARGRELVLHLAGEADVLAENFKTGALDRLGLGYADVAARHPGLIYLSLSGFGAGPSEYEGWPAFAPTVEAMSGIYEFKREGDRPPVVAPAGALGDIGTGLFATVGVLAALRQRDRTGQGQHVDVAMYDSLLALTDLVTNYWSMGLRTKGTPLIIDGFRASDGWFVVQVGRAYQFERLAELVGRPDWLTDDRLATPPQWREHLEDLIRPGIEAWAAGMTKLEAARALTDAGVAAGPCNAAPDVIADPQVARRHMLVEHPRVDGVDEPVLVPGMPIKLSGVVEGPDRRVPWLGEHTAEVLHDLLGLTDDELDALVADGVVSPPLDPS
jgi:crotonobetainyl-CoA:carnitine CoA-transferase CaiB-like acyl-CoA transferase